MSAFYILVLFLTYQTIQDADDTPKSTVSALRGRRRHRRRYTDPWELSVGSPVASVRVGEGVGVVSPADTVA
eukprot:CAMPEP_0194443264 /NCGR_PEP_ID=MMETSP0176-20130528/126608_1 /TAXON_ID=216777 /ORGANISM="Proboscia alata, Strain PI-D3" /LENGTH=71 /DNA_ID=CAMNT_0039269489 /DNA_START=1640 /DNA_END=1851 /DNA_ORIENTATION=-